MACGGHVFPLCNRETVSGSLLAAGDIEKIASKIIVFWDSSLEFCAIAFCMFSGTFGR